MSFFKKSLDLSFFDTSKVQNMYRLFENCTSLETLDLSHFNTMNVEDRVLCFIIVFL